LIFDTDVTIWILRGESRALDFARATPPERRLMSVVSQLELLEGCRNRREQRAVEELLNGWFAEIIPVDAGVSRLAARLMQQFGLSHRPGMADVLIAATALQTGDTLATSNVKHFRFVPGLVIEPFKAPG
jgi:predicted nucleic acid-binding protein